jgi:uncharacterized protein (TIGR03083 family)
MSTDETMLDELLGAYALDAVDAEEAVAVEEYLERAPRAADEVGRLRKAAAWIGATEALAPLPELHETVLKAARSRRPTSSVRSAHETNDPFLVAYLNETGRFDALLDAVPDDALDRRTFNGLTVRELVIHLAAMESSFAAVLGATTEPEITETEVEARTAAFVERYRGRPLVDIRARWREAVDAVRRWAADPANAEAGVQWLALHFGRDSLLVARSFETWTHTDDIRRALGQSLEPPGAGSIGLMADVSVRSIPAAMEVTERAHRDKTARVVLTGDGGGDWLIPLGFAETGETPDVALTADVVDWCRCVSERLAPEALAREVQGDPALADDLAAASSAFATL